MSKYRNSKVEFEAIELKTLKPVPSDIDIAQAQMANAKPITKVAEEIGLLEDELEPHGKYMAKVSLECIGTPERSSRWKICRCDRHYAYPAGRRQNHHYRWPEPGSGCALSVKTCSPASASHRKAQPLASRVARLAAATARSSQWRTSTCT